MTSPAMAGTAMPSRRAGSRASARTSRPSARSRSMRRPPMYPVAPVTSSIAYPRRSMSAHRHAPLNVWDYERIFEETLDAGAFGYFTGGADDEHTLRDNVRASTRWQLRPRMLVDVSEAAVDTTVLGAPVSMPLLISPTAFQRMAHPDGEPATARAAAAARTVMCLSTIATATPAEVAEAAPGAPRWFQLYWFRDEGVTRALVDQAVQSEFRAIVLTIDAPGTLGRRERDLRSG